MHAFIQDLRHAFRQLRNAPGFALTVILTLALGIGATTAIFTLVFDVLLRPLPYAHPEQLVVMEEQVAEFRDLYPTLPLNANHFEMWQRNARTIQAMAAIAQNSWPLGIGDHPVQVETAKATPGIFPVFACSRTRPTPSPLKMPSPAASASSFLPTISGAFVRRGSIHSRQNCHAQWLSLHCHRRHARGVPCASR